MSLMYLLGSPIVTVLVSIDYVSISCLLKKQHFYRVSLIDFSWVDVKN